MSRSLAPGTRGHGGDRGSGTEVSGDTVKNDNPDAHEGGRDSRRLAWEERQELGLFRAFGRTFIQTLFRPRVPLRNLPESGGVAGAILYALIAGMLGGSAIGGMTAFDEYVSQSLPPLLNLVSAACMLYASPVFVLLSTGAFALLLFPLWRSSRVKVTSFSRLFCVLCYTHGSTFCAFTLCFVIASGCFEHRRVGLVMLSCVPVAFSYWFVIINLLSCPMKGFPEKIIPSPVYLVLGFYFLVQLGFYWLFVGMVGEIVKNTMGP